MIERWLIIFSTILRTGDKSYPWTFMSLFPGQSTFDSMLRAYAVRDILSLSEMIVSIGDVVGK